MHAASSQNTYITKQSELFNHKHQIIKQKSFQIQTAVQIISCITEIKTQDFVESEILVFSLNLNESKTATMTQMMKSIYIK